MSSLTNAAPYNVCTITLNSKDEIEVFKKNLPSDKYNFIELTEIAKNAASSEKQKDKMWAINGWLTDACEQKITCDILMISSHQWQGRFFGESKNSQFRLTTDDLQKKRCDNSCSTLFENLKQVYLFGCNTMTTKDGDHQNLNSYLDYLAYDHHSNNPQSFLSEAHQNYSRASMSNNNAIRSIFTDVPQIYGFERRSPLGFHVGPQLEKYFQKVKLSGFEKQLDSKKSDPELMKLLGSQSMIMNSGFSSNDEPVQAKSSLICKLRSESDFYDKLDSVKNYISKNKSLNQNKLILEYIWPKDKNKMTSSEIERVEFFKNQPEVKTFFESEITKNPSLSGKLDIVYMGVYFGVFDLDSAVRLQKESVELFYKEKMTNLDKEILCSVMSYQRFIYLTDDDIYPAWSRSDLHKAAAKCIKGAQAKPQREVSSVKSKK